MRSSWFFTLLLLVGHCAYAADTTEKPAPPAAEAAAPQKNPAFIVFPIGINNDKQNVVPSALVRGAEDGKEAINLDQWLVPLDAITSALDIKTRTLDNGQTELRSLAAVVRLTKEQLQQDKEIGTVLSVTDIKKLLNVKVEFDMSQYALVLKPPTVTGPGMMDTKEAFKKVISFEGLETLQTDRFNFSAVSQQVRINGQKETINAGGDLMAVGNFSHGSWYMDINQAVITKPESWQLKDLQYFWKTDDMDYVFGSQPTFWQNKSGGDFWGVTLLGRSGFKEMPQSMGGFDPSSRRTTSNIGRTITGEAPPNSLARLVERFSNRVIAEVFVDTSGLYSFENVVSSANSTSNYDILIYPNGILTAEPIRVSSSFVSRAAQLQKGSSTWIISGGVNRVGSSNTPKRTTPTNTLVDPLNPTPPTPTPIDNSEPSYSPFDLWGKPSGFTGGVTYRYGLFESLTVGAGMVYSNGWQSLAEFFYSPSWLPFTTNVAATYDFKTKKYDYNAQAQWQLLEKLNANFSSTPLSRQAFLQWNPLSWLAFRAGGAINSSSTATVDPKTWFVGATSSGRFYNTSASINANFDSNAVLRLNSSLYREAWAVNYQRDDSRQQLDVSYNLSDSGYAQGNYGHSINLSAQTNKAEDGNNKLGVASWHYRSKDVANNGQSLIDLDLGYGIGSQGQGFLASLTTPMIPGVDLSFNYQDISAVSNDQQFSININTSAKVEPTLSLSNRSYAVQELRGTGGLFVQPFLDKNDNGTYDEDETLYLDNADHLLQLNGVPVGKSSMEVGLQGLYIRQLAGKYRLDLDPAGYPTEGQPREESFAIEIPNGAYATVLIPFSITYTIAGRVLDAQDQPIAEVKVDAIPMEKGNKASAVSNGAGVFFIDGLHQGKYQFLLDGQASHTEQVTIKSNSQTMTEVTLKK